MDKTKFKDIIGIQHSIAIKVGLLTTLGLFIALSILFHFSFYVVEKNILDTIKAIEPIYIYSSGDIKRAFSENRNLFIISTISSIFISVVVVMIVFNNIVKKPIKRLLRAIEQVERGNYDISLPVEGKDETALLCDKFNTMIKAVRDFHNSIVQEFINEKITIVDNIPVGIAIVDFDKKVLFANHAALNILNVKFEEFFERIFPFSITPGLIKEFEINQSSTIPTIIEMRCIVIEWQKSPAYLIMMVDVTRLKYIEKELREAKDKAEAATVAKSLFLANMSHEIRTPMNAVIGMTDILLGTSLSEEQRGYLNIIKTASETLLKIINDILDLSKIEAGKLELEHTIFSLDSAVEETISLFFTQSISKGLELKKEIDTDVPLLLKGDPLRLRQVLFNLLSNAIKFTEKGGITLTVKKVRTMEVGSVKRFNIHLKEDSKDRVMLLFCVKDTGIGIPYALQDKLFDAFKQADSSITRRYGGTGLGLAICKEIIKLMNGTIWVESEHGRGSEFYFTALFEIVKEQKHSTTSQQTLEDRSKSNEVDGNKTSYKTPKILVAEDDKINQKVMSLILQKNGIDYSIVENGRQVIERLEKEHFDMIFMDVQMPEMDGLETTRVIRKSTSGLFDSKIPIIAVTAFAFNEDIQRCLETGMDDFISKPIKAEKILEFVNKFAVKL